MNTKLVSIMVMCLTIAACGGGGSSSSNTPPTPPPTPTPATPTAVPSSGNFVHILITQGTSGVCTNVNAPCVSVTICQPGTSNCDTVDNILVDTGSFGLRVFGSLLTNTGSSLVTMQSGGESVMECVGYADGSSNWGPVQYATVGLNGTSTVESIPIHILNNTSFPLGILKNCPGATGSPAEFGLNGIIGVGPWQTDQNVSRYFACSGNGFNCSIIIPPAFITNPITKFGPGNNNGLTLVFGSVAQSGVIGADGYGIFGVGSAASNSPGSTGNPFSVFQIESNSNGVPINITSTVQGTNYSSFLDTGSNFFYFIPNALNITQCSGSNAGLFCPGSLTPETATMTGANGIGGSSLTNILFAIGNADDLANSGNTAFGNVGAAFAGIGGIDWGLPFYLGRTVYMVFAGESAVIGGVSYPASPNGYWIY